RLAISRGQSPTTIARVRGAAYVAPPPRAARPPTWIGCSTIRARYQYRRKNRLFRTLTARRRSLLGVLPQNGLRQEHRQDRRARRHYCPSGRDAQKRPEV